MMAKVTNQKRGRLRKSVQFNIFLEEIYFEEIPNEDSKKKQNWYTVSTDMLCRHVDSGGSLTYLFPVQYDEKKTFEREIKDTIKTFKRAQKSGAQLRDPSFCLRGLEDLVSARMHLNRKSRMMEYKASLVKEQERRRMAGLTHPFEMHEFSRSISRWALERALELAQNDAVEALFETSPSLCTLPHHITKIVNIHEECPTSVSLPPRHSGSLVLLHPNKIDRCGYTKCLLDDTQCGCKVR